MLVRFKATWFSPTEVEIKTKFGKTNKVLSVSGKRFRKGIQEVPNSLKDYLPSSAEIVNDHVEPVVVEEVNVLRDLDEFRAAEDMMAKAHEEADEVLEKRKRSKKET
jgi:hypothetical protein